MTGPLLRTGNLTDFHPLGAVGNPVYLAAAQLRAALSRRLDPALADSFAIPQRNQDGDTIDWYAPTPGDVVPWSAAGADEREEAGRRLREVRERIEALGQTLTTETDSERQVFGRLLAHVTRFPDEDHIYLVNGMPVVTFWGFVKDRDRVGADPLVDLSGSRPQPHRRRLWWLWLLLPLLLASVLSVLALRTCQSPSPPPPAPGEDADPARDPTLAIPDSEPRPEPGADDQDQDVLPATEPESVRLDQRHVDRHTRVETKGGVQDVTTTISDEPEDLQVGDSIDDAVQVSGEDSADVATDLEVAETLQGDEAKTQLSESTAETVLDGEAEATAVEPTDDLADDSAVDPLEDAVAQSALDDVEEGTAEDPTPVEDEVLDEATVSEVASQDAPDEVLDEETVTNPDATETPAPDAEPEGGSEEEEGASAQTSASEETTPEDGQDGAQEQPTTEAAPSASADPESPDARASAPEAEAVSSTAAKPLTRRTTRTAESMLRSGWRTASSLQDADGMPVQMEYQMQEDGAGKIRVRRHDGSICENGAAAVVRDGKLVVDSNDDIVCRDGANFGAPTIECAPDEDGKVGCQGRYQDGRTFSIEAEQPGDN